MYNFNKNDNNWFVLTHIEYTGSTIHNVITGIPNTQYVEGNVYHISVEPDVFTQNGNVFTCSAATYTLSSNTMYVTGSTTDTITYNNEFLSYNIPNIFNQSDLTYLLGGECKLNIITELSNVVEKIKIK